MTMKNIHSFVLVLLLLLIDLFSSTTEAFLSLTLVRTTTTTPPTSSSSSSSSSSLAPQPQTSIARDSKISNNDDIKTTNTKSLSRCQFLSSSFVGVIITTTMATTSGAILLPPPAALAVDDITTKGTKKDPAFEACLSKCMYECTKPKVDGQKTRKECLPDCKKQCATTNAQLLLGTPIMKKE